MSLWSYEDILDQRYAQYLDERKCVCGENDDCCCVSLTQFEDKWIKKYEETKENLMEECI